MTDHDRLGELAGPYALGALREDDRRAFETHMATCVECRREVRDAALVAEGLGRVVDPQEPPAGLRDRVLAAAVASARTARHEVRGGRPRLEDARSAAAHNRYLPASWLLLAASLAAVALGLYAWTLQSRLRETDAALRSTQTELAALETQLTQLQRTADEAARMAEVLFAPDVVLVNLAGQAAAPRATGRALYSTSRGLVFTASNLPPLPAGRVYQLWVVTKAAPLSAGLMRPDNAGRLRSVTQTAASQPTAIALTIEPEGGVPAPTGAMYLVGSL